MKLIQWNWSSIRSKAKFAFVIESSPWFFCWLWIFTWFLYLWPNTRWKLPSASTTQQRRQEVDQDDVLWCLSESCVTKKIYLESTVLTTKDSYFWSFEWIENWLKYWRNEFSTTTAMFGIWSNATYSSNCVLMRCSWLRSVQWILNHIWPEY